MIEINERKRQKNLRFSFIQRKKEEEEEKVKTARDVRISLDIVLHLLDYT